MCRVLIYLGNEEASVYDLLYGTDNSLVRQTYAPQLMKQMLNLAGFGFCAWSRESFQPQQPFYYRTTNLPFYDDNLERLSNKMTTHCMLAHIRGVEFSTTATISNQNVHPFKLDSTQLTLAHNGHLARMPEMKYVLRDRIKPDILGQLKGTTDSEWIYGLFLSHVKDYTADISLDEAWDAVHRTLGDIRQARRQLSIDESSPVNLFVTNGNYIIVTRFVYDYGCHLASIDNPFFEYRSLWATFGQRYAAQDGVYKMQPGEKRGSILFASEPLTKDRTTWIELPEYSITKAWIDEDEVMFQTVDLVV